MHPVFSVYHELLYAKTKNDEQNADDIDIDVIPIHDIFSILDIPRGNDAKTASDCMPRQPVRAFHRVPFHIIFNNSVYGEIINFTYQETYQRMHYPGQSYDFSFAMHLCTRSPRFSKAPRRFPPYP